MIKNDFRTVPDVAQLVGDQTKEAATAACAASLAAVREARSFFRDMSKNFAEQVLHSHGDHIDLLVRDGAT
eukprot:8036574-Alexandrium_andersonii.AAC.1